MNIEHLCRFVKENFHQLKDKKAALSFIKYHFELLAWKRGKLKLGAIVFDVKEVRVHTFVLWEEIEIRFIRQDTSTADEQKLENIIKRLGWQWDMRNYIALTVVITCLLIYLKHVVKDLYEQYLPTLAFRPEAYNDILEEGFKVCFASTDLASFATLKVYNCWLVEVFTDFCIHFNLVL